MNFNPQSGVFQAMLALETYVRKSSGLDPSLLELVRMRSSQINGCAYCLEMHTDEALRLGEKPERMTALDGWHESPLYTDKERAVLAWVDEVTLIAEKHASKEAFDRLKSHFSDEEIGWLILAVVQINSWNRIAISTRAQYVRAAHTAHAEKTPEPA
jgi:AhpD family alkylhydroperoxidase